MGDSMNYKYDSYEISSEEFEDDPGFGQWCDFSFSRKMIEIYGEAARLTKWVVQNMDKASIDMQWDNFARYCGMSFADPNMDPNEKYELFYAYKDLMDYAYSENPICKSRDAAMKWFSQWMNEYHLKEANAV